MTHSPGPTTAGPLDSVDLKACNVANTPNPTTDNSTDTGVMLGNNVSTTIAGLVGVAAQEDVPLAADTCVTLSILPLLAAFLLMLTNRNAEPQIKMPLQHVVAAETPTPLPRPKQQIDGVGEHGMVK